MGRPLTEEKREMTREEVKSQILGLEENPSYHPGAKGVMAGDKAEFSENKKPTSEKGPSLGPRKHVGRGGKS